VVATEVPPAVDEVVVVEETVTPADDVRDEGTPPRGTL
jgi:hypothetical protein